MVMNKENIEQEIQAFDDTYKDFKESLSSSKEQLQKFNYYYMISKKFITDKLKELEEFATEIAEMQTSLKEHQEKYSEIISTGVNDLLEYDELQKNLHQTSNVIEQIENIGRCNKITKEMTIKKKEAMKIEKKSLSIELDIFEKLEERGELPEELLTRRYQIEEILLMDKFIGI